MNAKDLGHLQNLRNKKMVEIYREAMRRLNESRDCLTQSEKACWESLEGQARKYMQTEECGMLMTHLAALYELSCMDYSQQVLDRGEAIRDYQDAILLARQAHRNTLATLLTEQEIESYDLTLNWPKRGKPK